MNKILVIFGEPNSIFSEIFFKYLTSKKFKKSNQSIIIIGCKKLIYKQMQKLKFDIYLHSVNDVGECKEKISIINVNYKFKKIFSDKSINSNRYIKSCFEKGIELLKKNTFLGLINGPISKEKFLKKKYLGITEYLSKITKVNDPVMLIYNENISVSPITTHLPINKVSKFIKKKKIIKNIIKINNFYKYKLSKNANIAVLGLNPHCESIDKISEEKKEIIPAIKFLRKKKIKIKGPFPADTFFLKKNIKKFDVVVGMYHDQVLTPLKTLYNFNAINITIGLPFIRVSPDHGPNFNMIGKNISDPSSIFCAMKFFNRIK